MFQHFLIRESVGLVAIVALGAVQTVTAQQPSNPAGSDRGLDRYILTQLRRLNEDEIALGRLGLERASSPQVRAFAAQIIEDQAGVLKLLQAVPGAANAWPKTAASPAGDSAAAQFVRLMEQAHVQYQRSITRELSEKHGLPFDRAFVASQLFAHLRMIDALTTYESKVSAGLRIILQEWIQVAQYHLVRAEELAMRVEQVASRGAGAGGIFGPPSTGTPGAARGTNALPRTRIGLAPLPMTTQSPRGPNGSSP